MINASAASPQRSWRLDASVCLASRWSIRSNKDQVETPEIVIGPDDSCYKRPLRREEKARSSLPALLRLGLTGHWLQFLAISILVLPK